VCVSPVDLNPLPTLVLSTRLARRLEGDQRNVAPPRPRHQLSQLKPVRVPEHGGLDPFGPVLLVHGIVPRGDELHRLALVRVEDDAGGSSALREDQG
jgi:hypothetical protein